MKKISYNAPLTLTFSICAVIIMVSHTLTSGQSTIQYFSVYRSHVGDPLFFVRLFTHVLGHGSWEHLSGNVLLLLILGPMLEEKYGTKDLLLMFLWTAFMTGMINLVLFPHALLGASGIVFMMIVLSSFTKARKSEIPLTMIIVTVVYIGREVAAAWLTNDNISRITHITGGMVGAWFGFKANDND